MKKERRILKNIKYNIYRLQKSKKLEKRNKNEENNNIKCYCNGYYGINNIKCINMMYITLFYLKLLLINTIFLDCMIKLAVN